MSKLYVRLIAIGTLIPAVVFATGYFNQNTPTQAYESADQPQQQVATANSTAQPAVAAKTAQQAPKTTGASQPAAKAVQQKGLSRHHARAQQLSARDAAAYRQALKLMQAEINQLNQNNLLFQQQTDSRLVAIDTQIKSLQNQVKQVDQVATLLNKEMTHLNVLQNTAEQQPALQSTIAQWVDHWERILGPMGLRIILGAIGVLLVFLIWAALPRRSKRAKMHKTPFHEASAENNNDDDDTQDEYDYMGSSESIPAKLNLIRAYIAMEDFDAAKKVLTEVLSQGDDEQKAQAEELQQQIPA